MSMRDHQGTNQGGSREGSLQADRGSSKSPELGECVCVSTRRSGMDERRWRRSQSVGWSEGAVLKEGSRAVWGPGG